MFVISFQRFQRRSIFFIFDLDSTYCLKNLELDHVLRRQKFSTVLKIFVYVIISQREKSNPTNLAVINILIYFFVVSLRIKAKYSILKDIICRKTTCSQSTADSARNIHVFIRVLCIKAVNYVKPI